MIFDISSSGEEVGLICGMLQLLLLVNSDSYSSMGEGGSIDDDDPSCGRKRVLLGIEKAQG
jgi:hypothetical protein